jgi:S-adenosylmethionine synthetase
MSRFTIQTAAKLPTARRRFEHVERKGLGHPDTICDAVAEAISTALCRTYVETCGRVLHHNADKALLAAGCSTPRLGGGTVKAPMQLFLGDRATAEVDGKPIPIAEIAETAARDWFRRSLRFVDADRQLSVQSVLRPGSVELTDLFARSEGGANDTSVGVGSAPLTETERLTLEAERRLNSPDWKARYPEIGEDVKVMAVRCDRQISLTVAAAFVDRFVPDAAWYFSRKAEIIGELKRELSHELRDCDAIDIGLNVLDDPARGAGGMYLTVTGTSAEGADSGQVGRGNRANGLISPHRAMSLEAVAGKNPVSHVGKIYNVLALQAARRIAAVVDRAAEATVWICSRIGRRLDDPWSVAVELVPRNVEDLTDAEPLVQEVIDDELHRLPDLMGRLSRGEIIVY